MSVLLDCDGATDRPATVRECRRRDRRSPEVVVVPVCDVEVLHDGTGVFNHAGTAARTPGSDPDGNSRLLQQITDRLIGRGSSKPL